MLKKIYVFLADGFEEIEALTVVDLLRRAELDVVTVSIKEESQVMGSHQIPVTADACFSKIDCSKGDLLVLPGGAVGTENLEKFQPLLDLVKSFVAQDKKVAAICAAPRILAGLGLLNGRKATSYPSVMEELTDAQTTTEAVAVDGCITTSRGLGTAIDFSLELIGQLISREKAKEIAESVVYGK
ncbi:MAG: DJ-1/PfpI family protein [Lachnospiraceae bacterium]|nr:DJ-1/PfpI family protein [Lachnospiraceae bacterium]